MADAVEGDETSGGGTGASSAAGDWSAMDNMRELLRSMGFSEEELKTALSELR